MEHVHTENCNHESDKVSSKIVEFAYNELKNAGLFDENSDYNGKLGGDVLDIIKLFSSQGHSGQSAFVALSLINRLLSIKPLTEISEPMIGDYIVYPKEGENTREMWQLKRCPHIMSFDYGLTWACHYSPS